MNISKLIQIIIFLCLIISADQAYSARLKIATLSPEGSFWMEKMRAGAKEIEQKTSKRVRIKYYPGGVMGDDKAVLRKIRIGQLHGGAVVAGSLSSIFADTQIYGLPLKFKSFEEIEYVRKKMDPLIIEGLEKGGFIVLGMAGGGFAYMMSKKPLAKVDDMADRKIWVPDNDPSILEGVKAFEISPIPLSIADVRAGLQTGLIDTVTTSPIGAIALQWHTQIKYLMDMPFLYIYALLAVDKKAFSKISLPDQKILREVLGRIFKEIELQNRKDNVKALNALKHQGIQFIHPPLDAINEWYERSAKIPAQLIKSGRFSQKIVDTLENYLIEFRSK